MIKRLSRRQIAWRIAQDIKEGMYVNLGIGQPELVANYVKDNREVIFHSENGILGMGPEPSANDTDFDLINAGKKPVTLLAGGSFFHHADSFAMIRGSHIDISVLGAFQVSENGDLANWSTGDVGAIPAVGGAMDLAVGSRRVFVMTDHNAKGGEPKLVEKCTYPLTASGVVNTVYSDLAVIDITSQGFCVREKIEGLTFSELQDLTGARLLGKNMCKEFFAPEMEC